MSQLQNWRESVDERPNAAPEHDHFAAWWRHDPTSRDNAALLHAWPKPKIAWWQYNSSGAWWRHDRPGAQPIAV